MYILNDKKGITLIEALVSAIIITLVMLGILATLIQTIDISKRINFEYTSSNVAKSRLERARSIIDTSGFSTLVDFTETDTVVDESGVPDLNGYYRRDTAVTANYGGDANLAQVDVTVEYKYKGEWKTNAAVSITTVFSSIE
jgi:type II secretory pathway pseudopilin PulG